MDRHRGEPEHVVGPDRTEARQDGKGISPADRPLRTSGESSQAFNRRPVLALIEEPRSRVAVPTVGMFEESHELRAVVAFPSLAFRGR